MKERSLYCTAVFLDRTFMHLFSILATQVDYYNATGGRWEPLLERVVAQGDRAIVTRRRVAAQDPNIVTGAVGGGQGEEGEGEGETCSVVRLSCFEEDVKVRCCGRFGLVTRRLAASGLI